MLVAVVMLFVVGAMAALSIDVVTLYTARSEAQVAADGAALAAARVLANSGMTSDPNAASDGLMTNAWTLAQAVAIRVAEQNEVGGRNLTAAEVTLPPALGGTNTNPTVTVRVQRADLPTFFARIWAPYGRRSGHRGSLQSFGRECFEWEDDPGRDHVCETVAAAEHGSQHPGQ